MQMQVSHFNQYARFAKMKPSTFPSSSDPLVRALQQLVRDTQGGYKAIAQKIGANDQSLYQIVTCRPDSKTARPKSVGKQLRDKLTQHYPRWQDNLRGIDEAQLVVTPATQPSTAQATAQATITLGQALATLAHQLQSADDLGREQAGVLLKRLASEPERAAEFAVRLAATLSSGQEGGASAASINPITQPPGFLPKP